MSFLYSFYFFLLVFFFFVLVYLSFFYRFLFIFFLVPLHPFSSLALSFSFLFSSPYLFSLSFLSLSFCFSFSFSVSFSLLFCLSLSLFPCLSLPCQSAPATKRAPDLVKSAPHLAKARRLQRHLRPTLRKSCCTCHESRGRPCGSAADPPKAAQGTLLAISISPPHAHACFLACIHAFFA